MRKLLVLGACLSAIGCSDSSATAEKESTLVVAALVPQTGPNANPYLISALELAFDEVNQALADSPASHGIRFELAQRDDESVNARVRPLATELLELNPVVMVTVTSGTSGIANGMNYDGSAAVPVVCGSCTNNQINSASANPSDAALKPGYQDLDNWLRRTTIVGNYHMPIMIKDMFSRGPNSDGDLDGNGVVKVGVISLGDRSAFNDISGAATPLHPKPEMLTFELTPIEDTLADPNTFDFASKLVLANDPNNLDTGKADGLPDYLVNWVFPAFAAGVAKAYKQGGYTTPMMNSSSFRRTSILQTLGANADGQQGVSNQCWTTDASGEHFRTAFTQKSGSEPAAYDSSVYDSMAVALLGALKAAIALDDPSEVTGNDVKEALDQINAPGGKVVRPGVAGFKSAIEALAAGKDINYEGASGPCDFDAVGDVKGNVAIYEVQNQKFVETAVYDCIADDSCPLKQ